MKRTFAQTKPADPPHEITFEGYYQVPPPKPAGADDDWWVAPDEWTETFHFLPNGVFSETGAIIASIGTNHDGDMVLNQLDLCRFLISAAVPGDDRDRLVKLLDDPYRGLANDQAMAIVQALIEDYSGKASTT